MKGVGLASLILLLLVTNTTALEDLPIIYQLRDHILKNYDSGIRPVYNQSTITNLSLSLQLAEVIDVGELSQSITISVIFEAVWSDEFLTWKKDHFGDLDEITLIQDRIWKPSIVPQNRVADLESPEIHINNPIVTHEGHVTMVGHAVYQLSCALDLSNYPYDENTCYIRFYQSDKSIEFTSVHMVRQFLTNSTEFNITVSEPQILTNNRGVEVEVKLVRYATFFISIMWQPLAIISSLAPMAHLLPPDSEAKFDLTTTVVVAFTLMLAFFQNTFPPSHLPNKQVHRLMGSYIYLIAQTAVHILIVRMSQVSTVQVPERLFKVATAVGSCVLLLPPVGKCSTLKNYRERESNEAHSSPNGDAELNDKIEKLLRWLADQDAENEIRTKWTFLAALADRMMLIALTVYIIYGYATNPYRI